MTWTACQLDRGKSQLASLESMEEGLTDSTGRHDHVCCPYDYSAQCSPPRLLLLLLHIVGNGVTYFKTLDKKRYAHYLAS